MIDNHFTVMQKNKTRKTVSFTPETKKHDSIVMSPRVTAYYQILSGYLQIKQSLFENKVVKCHNDILLITNFDNDILQYCKDSLGHFITILRNKQKEKEENFTGCQFTPTVDCVSKETDKFISYWESDRFRIATLRRQSTRYKVSAVRKGSRDLVIYVNAFKHLLFCENLYKMIKCAIKENEDDDENWFKVMLDQEKDNDWILV